MANLVRLSNDRVELPLLSLQYSLTPPIVKLQEALAAYDALKADPTLLFLPLPRRQEVVRFLRQFGALLFRTLFPADAYGRLDPHRPLLLEPGADWSAYPWELLHDGVHWLALHQGLLRYPYTPDAGTPQGRPAHKPLRVLGVTAHPLPLGEDSRVARETRRLGARFISSRFHPGEGSEGRAAPIVCKWVEHASPQALESALAASPEVLWFSGFASEEGWFLESERLTAQSVGWPWLLGRIREAVARGLELIVLNDSQGLGEPLGAFSRTRELLRAGVPAVVRLEGRQGRRREQEYLRTLLRQRAGGASLVESHLAAVRRLHRRGEAHWDWSFVRLYPQAMPPEGDFVLTDDPARERRRYLPPPMPPAPLMPPAPPTAATDAAGGGRVFETPPAPPVFRARRRFFAGHTGLRRLADALQPGTEGASPLVFLSGGAGSGKTWLALEAARRLHRRFAMVLYLHDRMLLPHPFDTAPVTGLARPADPPGKPLFAALACHLHAPPASNGALSEWKEAIVRHCSDGVPRLLILDGLEHRPGHAGLCEALAALPPACRALVVTRDKPPLVPGVHLEQTPVSPAELGRMFDEGLPERLRALDPQGRLLEHCCGDLFAARLLRRHPAPPSPERLREALAPAEQGPSPAVRLLELLVEDALPSLGEEVREVLAVLALLPALVHREALAGSCALDDRRLQVVLDELQWLGWVDLHESDRYVELAHRLHRPVAERLLTLGALARVQARLIRVYQAFLAGLATDLEHQGSRWRTLPPPLLAWAEERCEGQPPGRMLLLHRLGVERVNLAELALLLCEEGDWRPLARLVAGAFPLAGWRELEELWGLLHHCLLAAGEARADPVMQAQALNRLAEPALRVRNAERARPMLERALELLGRTPGWEVLGETYRMLARCYELLGKLDPALNLLYAAVELAQQLDNPEDLVRACERLVPLWVRRGADGAAAERFLARQALDLRQNGRHPHAALVARLQGELLLRLGRPEEAIVLLHDVLESFHALDDGRGRADTLVHLAECHVRLGEGERALELMTTAGDPGAASAGAAEERGRVWSELCRLFEQRNQPQQALEGYLSIRRLLEEMGDREALIGVLDRIGGLYYQLGEQAKSTQCYEERLHLQAALTPS